MKNQQLKILIADQQPIFRIGLQSIIGAADEFSTPVEATNGHELMEKVGAEDFDLVVMDVVYPDIDGIALLRQVLTVKEELSILVLSDFREEDVIVNVLKAGARGYILKTAGHDVLLHALRAVAKGQSYFSPEVSSQLLPRIVKEEKDRQKEDKIVPASITPRERQILLLICEEFTNPEIAVHLNISRRTVDTHRKNLLYKTRSRNTVGLIKFAMRERMI
jgi:DNA-binding NarL/FixJ family response regulator